ncbi:MAG: EAL domain-containing protein [Devosia nanyangense]|uniref:EAL domain-containing protein n=1 Tax=Devosia nanyangense TaxID=1228055 RepID=A0A933L0V3_9HYPH|nr:EAL domain-containing protein [Devosia nanyangense]
MHKHFAKLLEKARNASGALDEAALDRLVMAELNSARREVALQNRRIATALDSTGHAISIYDRHQKLVYCNDKYLALYRLPKRLGRRGTSFEDILKGRIAANSHVGDDLEHYVSERVSLVDDGEPSTEVHTLNSGEIVSITHQPLTDGGWVSTHKDITEFSRLQAELGHRAYHDALTGLPNRHLLQQRIAECLAEAAGLGSFALLLIDLDGFKAINDTLGHGAGDQVLREVAMRLETTTGAAGMVARMGGDEFAVVMEIGATARDAQALALRLAEAGKRPFVIDGQPASIGFSIGVAVAPGDGSTGEQLLKNADLALYAEKHGRRGSYSFFEPSMDKARRDKRQLERDLGLALERGEFELYYQPILNLRTQAFSGFEALLRWHHRIEGSISPARFIPVAEETGLIVPIGEWVLREAIAEASKWPPKLRIAINVSSVQFQRGNVVATIMNALGASGLAPERVEIEITESVFFDNSTANLDALRQLHALGLKIALDDFGTGFSAMSYLLSYPFDKIKIDGSFVRALENAAGAQTIVRAIAEIGHGMGITTTAEGIETAAQLRNVHAAGYNEAQGFLIARPMPASQVRKMLDGEDDRMPFAPMVQRAAG